jgi:hypothetical protein
MQESRREAQLIHYPGRTGAAAAHGGARRTHLSGARGFAITRRD